MNSSKECLSQSALQAIVCSQADQADTKQWESHLEHCAWCCESLESLSADDQTWDAVRRFLPDDVHDRARFTGALSEEWEASDSGELLPLLAPTDAPRMLGRLGRHEVSEVVGFGGMGVVLKAFDPDLSRFVAIKALAPRLWRDARARERFGREARSAASIVHENVIEIYGVDEADGIPFFTMPYVRGESLQARIHRQGPLHVSDILRIAAQVASGLAAVHAQGLVHRDVKPANILLGDGTERVWITDFGVAHSETDSHITQTGWIAGTPRYMSPEQVRGETVESRSDLFSLGSVIYVMCTGRAPFESDSNYQLLSQVAAANPKPIEEINPSIPSWLAAIVAKLHSPLPADRGPAAQELAAQLKQCWSSAQQPAAVSLPRAVARWDAEYRRRRPSRISPRFIGGLVMFAAAVILLTLLGSAVWLSQTPATAQSIDVRGRLVDSDGNAVAKETILAVKKTWPNNRYRQQTLKTATDQNGDFAFEDFAQPGSQYAFMLTVVSDNWLMTSEYRLVEDGKQQDPIELETAKAKPVVLQFRDSEGMPAADVRALPHRRTTKDGVEHINYAQQVWEFGAPVDKEGKVEFASWLPGEPGAIVYVIGEQIETFKFTIPEERVITVTVDSAKPKPAPGPPIHVAGQVVDADGKPLADVAVLAIQKTWPNNRYRQDALSTTTDAQGKFRFDKFARRGKQYAFLLSVLADGYAMTSEYEVVEDGAQQPPTTLTLQPAEPVTFVFQDAEGQPLQGLEASPARRGVDESTYYLNYSMHMKATSKTTDQNGEASFTAWKPGESGAFYYRYQEGLGEVKFEVGQDRKVRVTLPAL